MFFNIAINKALTTYLASKKYRLDELFVIACFHVEKLDLLKDYLNGRTGDQITAYLQSLERKQLLRRITPQLEDFDWDNYELTSLGLDVAIDCSANIIEAVLENTVAEEKPLTKREALSKNEEFAAFMTKFIEYFPEGTRNGVGEYLRSNTKDLIKKMITFVMKYDYDHETMLKATENYTNVQKRSNYQYCNAAHYFVSKDGVSKLAAECDSILRGDTQESSGEWMNRM